MAPKTPSAVAGDGSSWLQLTQGATVAMTISANENEIMPRSAKVNGALPFTIKVAGTEPTPMNTRNAVPMNSAVSRWAMEVSSSMVPLPVRIYRMSFDNVECDTEVTRMVHSWQDPFDH